jgi:hypothetical protein
MGASLPFVIQTPLQVLAEDIPESLSPENSNS